MASPTLPTSAQLPSRIATSNIAPSTRSTPSPVTPTHMQLHETISESSDEGIRMTPAAARRFARRSLRRNSPTPDLVTSLVRPPSPDALYAVPEAHTRALMDAETRAAAEIIPIANPRQPPITRRRSGPITAPHLSSLDLPRRYGGTAVFDMYSLTYVGETDPSLLCPICHDPLIDPVTTPCDHTFCYRCIRGSLASSPSGSACPIDREPLVWSECFTSARIIRTQLNALVVKCPMHNRGCSHKVRRELIEKHVLTDCRFTEYNCPDDNCDKKLRYKPTENHCLHIPGKCNYCETEIEVASREMHMLSCPQGKTRCDACWQLISRALMKAHEEAECLSVEVACTYAELGCPTRRPRGQMPAHTSVCAFHPDTPSGAVIRAQREVIATHSDVVAQLQELRMRQDETANRLDSVGAAPGLRNTNSAVGDSVPGITGQTTSMQDLDAGFEEIHQSLTHLEARQSMWTMNQVMPIREEVTELRNNINMLRMHVNWLLGKVREEGRVRVSSGTGSTSATGRAAGDMIPSMPERRRSSGTDTDLPRL